MLIYYIDPQSYRNLAVYDHSLLKGMEGHDIVYFNSIKYDHEALTNARTRSVFSYNDKKNPLAKLLSYAVSIIKVAGYALRERPDVIHIQWFRAWLIDYLLVLFFHILGIKVVYTAHNILPHTHHIWDKFIFSRYYKVVDAIIVHSERTRNEMLSLFPLLGNKIHVIRHGILESRFDESAVTDCIRKLRGNLGISEDSIVFSCLGVQNKYKGTDRVMEAWKQSKVMQNNVKCHLLFVGKNDGLDFSAMREMENVHVVCDHVSNEEFEAYLRMSSVVMLPYINISQSGVLFSALQADVPVLVSDVGGLSEPLTIARVGWCLGAPTVDNIRTQMEHLAENAGEISSVKTDATAFERVRNAYNWSEISRKTQTLYASFIYNKQ